MVGAWASAESTGVASLKGTYYTPSLFDGNIPEVTNWRTFQEGLAPMKQMVTRYKRTFASLLAPIALSNLRRWAAARCLHIVAATARKEGGSWIPWLSS